MNQTTGGRTVGLVMIVKNEAHVIERCLRSVLPLISFWTIVDTGSTDSTRDVIRDILTGFQGRLHERPWVDFGYNRSEALKLAESHTDYLFVVDADDQIVFENNFSPEKVKSQLVADAGLVKVVDHGISYKRMHFFRSQHGWRYEGILDEYATCGGTFTSNVISGISYVRIGGGGRSINTGKFDRDITVLKAALNKTPGE